jgi:hypothetical protein
VDSVLPAGRGVWNDEEDEKGKRVILFCFILIHCFDWLSGKLKMSPGNGHYDVREVDELYSR